MAGGRKGLSYEEKRSRMLEYFYENPEVHTLKTLEKCLHKAKGIVTQSIKEILQSLVDDDLVCYDKIGSGNFYWALPSKATAEIENSIRNALENLEKAESRRASLIAEKQNSLIGKEDTEERIAKLQTLEDLKAKNEELQSILTAYKERGSDTLSQLKTCKNAVNRWTDNVYSIKKVFNEMRPEMKDSELFEYFGLGSDFDYID